MSEPEQPKESSRTLTVVCTITFVLVGVLVYHTLLAPQLVPEPFSRGAAVTRLVWMGIIALGCASVGPLVARWIERLRR